MSTRNNKRWLGSRLAALVIWTVLAVPLLGAFAVMISLQLQSAALARESSDVQRQLEQKVGHLHALLNSMVSVHVATSDNQSALVGMAEKLRQDNPEITAVGSYMNVPLSEREAFESDMANSGLYDFRIMDLVGSARVPSPERNDAIPISLLEPMTPELLPLLGSDLAANSELQTSLSVATGRDLTVGTVVPDDWPAAGQLMMLQSAYQVPGRDNFDYQQDNGGCFLIIDPANYLADLLDENLDSNVKELSLALRRSGQESLLARKRFSNEHLIASDWFSPTLHEHVFELANSSLVISIKGARGIDKNHLVTALFFIVLATACFFAALSWMIAKRDAVIESEALQVERYRFSGDSVMSMKPVRQSSGNREVTLAVWLLLLVPVLGMIAVMISKRYQSDAFLHESSDVVRMVEQRISNINGLFNSLVSASYATSGDRSALIAMADQLRLDNPKLTAVGRYQSAPFQNRSVIGDEVTVNRLDDLLVTTMMDSIQVIAPEKNVVMPISVLEPMTSRLLPLIGTDLADDSKLQRRLSLGIVQNSTVVTAIPADWPAARQLMVIRPTYRGLYAPQSRTARIQQADGGYLLIIDPEVYLEGLVDENLSGSVSALSLVLNEFSEDTPLAISHLSMDALFFRDLFDAPRVQRTFELGDASLVLSIEGAYGISKNHIFAAVGFITLTVALFIAAFLWLHERRRVVVEKLLSHDVLRAERDRNARTLHLISDAVITVNHQCVIQHVNTFGARFLGCTSQDLIDKPLDKFLFLHYRDTPSDTFNALQLLQDMRSDEPIALDLISYTAAANVAFEPVSRAFHGTVSLNEGSSEYPATAVFVFRDISAEKRLTAALEYQANHDALTGCANRHHFERQLDSLLENQTSQAAGNALLYIDLDRFKEINDTAGHAAGDMMLMQFTKELNHIIDSSDTLARLGGDEFGVLMSNVNQAISERKALQVHKLLQTMVFTHQDRGYPIRASLGLAHFDEVGNSPSEVMAAADMACYAAKDLGRNQLYVYRADDEAMTRRTSELEWLSLLRHALEANRFRLHAQPLVSVKNPEKFVRYEFLLRLADDEGHDLQASRIVSAAERYGMMRDIDQWVIDQAFSIIAELGKDDRRGKLIYAINLSGQSAADPTLIDFIKERILHHKVDPECVCFEITETAIISHFANAVVLSQAIRDMGAQIALDDFGSGLSSFAYLKNLAIDVLKIDGQFIKDLASDPVDQAMVKAIRDVACSMQITTVAECVETQATLDVLSEIGIDIAQGFHIGRPMPIGKRVPANSV